MFRGKREYWQNIEGNMSIFFREKGNKLDDEKMVSKFIERGTNKENVWEYGNTGNFGWEQGYKDPLGRPSMFNGLF